VPVYPFGWGAEHDQGNLAGRRYLIPFFCALSCSLGLVGCPPPGPRVTVPEVVGMTQPRQNPP